MLNRKKTPSFQKIEVIDILKATQEKLENHIPVYKIKTGSNPVMRLELFFPSGTLAETQNNSSLFTSKMLLEGTQSRTASEINEYIERFGAFIEIGQGFDQFYITLYVLEKHLKKILPIIKDLLTEAIFPQNELTLVKQIAKQNLEINSQKNAFIASRKLREVIFGSEHPYGKLMTEESIKDITQEHLLEFYGDRIKNKAFEIFMASSLENNELENIEHFFGQAKYQKISKPRRIVVKEENLPTEKEILIEMPDKVQSSIRIGKKLFNKSHEDFFKVKILNTIFGGYFGSRLMKNIREDKGLTYGIYSQIVTLQYGGYWVIGADVNKENTRPAIKEIFNEMTKLSEESIDIEELERVKNYIMGAFASSINTAFDLIDKFKALHFYNLGYDFYDNYFQTIHQITPEEIQETAQKYLEPESFTTVIVGGE